MRAIKEKQENMVANLEDEVDRLKESLKSRDGEMQQMRSVNEALRGSNAALRMPMHRVWATPIWSIRRW